MSFKYKVTDLKNNRVYCYTSAIDEFESYREFIGFVESMNEAWAGELRYEEDVKRI